MVKVHFTSNLRRHVDCAAMNVNASVLHDALEQAFAKNQRLKTYVLDDQGALRKHMRILIDGQSITDRQTFKDSVRPGSEIWVMQALSGG